MDGFDSFNEKRFIRTTQKKEERNLLRITIYPLLTLLEFENELQCQKSRFLTHTYT